MKYGTILRAIPTEWADTLLKGNQSFYNDEFFATVLGSQIGDVYRYKNGTLHYYQWDDHDENAGDELHDNIKLTIYSGVSGQTNQEGDYPTLNQLKRIKVAKNDGTLTVVSWYLSDYTKDRLIYGGIVPNMFTHDLGAKQWRAQQFGDRHRHIREFCSVVFNDPEYDLTKVTKTLRNLPITDINRDNMYKIINKGLYMGKVAHDYQREKKGVGVGSPILVPSYCIYTAHSYDPLYTPREPKPTGTYYQGPGMKPQTGSTLPGNHHFFEKSIFDLRPDLVHF